MGRCVGSLAGQVLLIADAGALVPYVMHLDEGRVVTGTAAALSGHETRVLVEPQGCRLASVGIVLTGLQDRSDTLSLDEAWSKLEAEEKGEAIGDERLSNSCVYQRPRRIETLWP